MTRVEYERLVRVRRYLENLKPNYVRGSPTSYWPAVTLLDLVLQSAKQESIMDVKEMSNADHD